jgi:hypothetical protein
MPSKSTRAWSSTASATARKSSSPAPRNADFWTVYGHYRTGGVDAFEDFATEAEAVAFHDRLIATYPHLAGKEG